MKKKYLITIAIVLGVILLDQSSKLYIDRLLPLHYSIPIVKNFIHITYVRNTGAAFGLLASQGTGFKVLFFFITSIIAITVIIIAYLAISGGTGAFSGVRD